jgi:hypothetical protein
MNQKFRFWLNVTIAVCAMILLISGYFLGYYIENRKSENCVSDPLIYGITAINEFNRQNYACHCYSEGKTKRAFYFDENGVDIDTLDPTNPSLSLNSSLY